MRVIESLKVPNTTKTQEYFSLKKRSFVQPFTSRSIYCYSCGKIRFIATMCKINKDIVKRVHRWVPKGKKNDAIKEIQLAQGLVCSNGLEKSS